MKIAFYAPLKSPDHPVPSGDRLMARQLVAALQSTGHEVFVASHLRSFHKTPETVLPDFDAQVAIELERLSGDFEREGTPDIWFCYHPYYKAPDLIGPSLAGRFGFPYVTAEASYSNRRNIGVWAKHQAALIDGVNFAAINLCFTERDRAGLASVAPNARLARIAPFIDAQPFLDIVAKPQSGQLVTVAMMRPGDKLESYTVLADALRHVRHPDWRLTIIGDGPERQAVEFLFSGFSPERIEWLGELARQDVASELSRACVFVWPGHGEAYGLAYLEAQAAGLPVVAEQVAGVPEVVIDAKTGLLSAAGDAKELAQSIDTILSDQPLRQELGSAARTFVATERSFDVMARRISDLLTSTLELPS